MPDEIFETFKTNVNAKASTAPTKEDDPDLIIGYTVTKPLGPTKFAVQEKEDTKKLSEIATIVKALPSYNPQGYIDLANAMYTKGFISKSDMSSPNTVAYKLEYPAELYLAYVDTAKKSGSKPKDFYSWLGDYQPPIPPELGGGKYRGPVRTVTLSNEGDLRSTADAVASEVLGRAVTEEEFQKVLKKVRSAEKSQPTITTSVPGSTVSESGLSAEGRKDIIQETLMAGPEAREFGQATKMMDLFYSALNARPEGA